MKKRHIIITLLLLCSLLIILGVKYIMGAKDKFFYPAVINNIPPVNEDLAAILDEFEAILKEKNKAAYDTLNPGLSAEEILKLEEEYQVKLPEEIVTLYMWHDGSRDYERGLSVSEVIPGHWFVPLKYSLERNKYLKQPKGTPAQKAVYEALSGYSKTWMMLFDDSFGDGYYYDPLQKTGSGYVFYNFTEVGHYVFFSSLKNLLKAFVECYQEDIYRLDNTMDHKDYEAASKVMSKYGVTVN